MKGNAPNEASALQSSENVSSLRRDKGFPVVRFISNFRTHQYEAGEQGTLYLQVILFIDRQVGFRGRQPLARVLPNPLLALDANFIFAKLIRQL